MADATERQLRHHPVNLKSWLDNPPAPHTPWHMQALLRKLAQRLLMLAVLSTGQGRCGHVGS